MTIHLDVKEAALVTALLMGKQLATSEIEMANVIYAKIVSAQAKRDVAGLAIAAVLSSQSKVRGESA